MTPPPAPILAPCSRPSTPLRAACRGGLRPVLTAPARGALPETGRDGETPSSRTEKLRNRACPAKPGTKDRSSERF